MKINQTLRILCLLTAFMLGVFLPLKLAQAQQVPTGILYNLKTADFPTITFSLDAYGTTGEFMTGLLKKDFTIIEDGQKHQPDDLVVFDPGVEFVIAINPGDSFTILDNQGLSRYEKISKTLAAWAGNLPAENGFDAYSLVTSGGPSAFHTRDPKSWLTSLNAYQPDLKNPTPSLDILTRAIDIASTSLLEPGARRAILFITPMAETADTATLQRLALRASQLNVHIFVWILASKDFPATPGFLGLQELARATSGQFLLYSGSEKLPDPGEYLAPMRSGYQLTYTSGLTSSGSHALSVSISSPEGTIDLPPLKFEITILPPNPILVSPPDQILRQPADEMAYDLMKLTPASQKLEMIIEFPDGHPRDLASTSLLVDGQTIASNRSAPFDQFTWDLGSYTTSGKHDLQVAVEDMMGLQKVSVPFPVTITIAAPPTWWQVFQARYGNWVLIGIVLAAGLLLFWLVLRIIRKRNKMKETVLPDSSNQVAIEGDDKTNLHWHPKQAPAFLQPILDEGSVTGLLQLVAREIRLGSDPARANILLQDPSVAPLHAILHHQGNVYTILDQGSLAGTWLNYERLPEGRHPLKHGDILHFGAMAYRFFLSDPPVQPRLQITHIKPNS